jgi:hypothetical protein
MKKQDFSCSVIVNTSPQKTFEGILQVSKWWTKDFTGSSKQVNDEFIIQHGEAHYSKHKLTEMIPGRKLVWLITEGSMSWLQGNKHEWANTKTIFVLTPKGDQTLIEFTHEGLVPELECYSRVSEGWETVIIKRLYLFLTTGTEQSV